MLKSVLFKIVMSLNVDVDEKERIRSMFSNSTRSKTSTFWEGAHLEAVAADEYLGRAMAEPFHFRAALPLSMS